MGAARSSLGEIAIVVDKSSTVYHACRAGLNLPCPLILKQWHMSRLGAPSEQLLLQDLGRDDTPDYRLYVFPILSIWGSESDRWSTAG